MQKFFSRLLRFGKAYWDVKVSFSLKKCTNKDGKPYNQIEVASVRKFNEAESAFFKGYAKSMVPIFDKDAASVDGSAFG